MRTWYGSYGGRRRIVLLIERREKSTADTRKYLITLPTP
jgi:hypothetical protein